MKKIVITTLLIIVALLGYSLLCIPSISIGGQIHFQTQYNEYSFTAIPSKGRGYKMMERQFLYFKRENPQLDDLKVYRTTPIDLRCFCKYPEYLSRKEWHYPYLK